MSLGGSVVTATTIKPTVVANIEPASVMPACIATVMNNIMGMPMVLQAIATFGDIETGLDWSLYILRAHLLNGAPVGAKTYPCYDDSDKQKCKDNN